MSWYAYARTPHGHLLERSGLDFEDFQVGQRFVHRPGITVSQQDNVDEALDTLNGAMLHYDHHYAAHTQWKRPLMVSTLTLQQFLGMSSATFARRQRVERFASISMTAPVYGGDTLYAESEILELQEDDHQDAGRVVVRCQGLKQDGTVVARFTYDARVWRRGCGPIHSPPGVGALTQVQEERFLSYRQDGAARWVEQSGMFFEDFRAGESFLHWPCKTLTTPDGRQRAWRSRDWSPQFHDSAWMADQGAGQPLLPQAWVLGIATALTTRSFGRVSANLGWHDVELHHDATAGDTLRAQSTVLEQRLSRSRPHEGILTVQTRAFDQTQRLVLSFVRDLLVYKRSAASPYAAAGY